MLSLREQEVLGSGEKTLWVCSRQMSHFGSLGKGSPGVSGLTLSLNSSPSGPLTGLTQMAPYVLVGSCLVTVASSVSVCCVCPSNLYIPVCG